MRRPTTRRSEPSAPGDAHVSPERGPAMAPIDNKVVSLWLAGDRVVDCILQESVVGRGPQRGAQIGGVVLAEAHIKDPRAGDPHPIAGFAEIVRQGGNEPQAAAGLLDTDIARRAAGAILDVAKREALLEPRPYHRERQILGQTVVADVAERHHFDER